MLHLVYFYFFWWGGGWLELASFAKATNFLQILNPPLMLFVKPPIRYSGSIFNLTVKKLTWSSPACSAVFLHMLWMYPRSNMESMNDHLIFFNFYMHCIYMISPLSNKEFSITNMIVHKTIVLCDFVHKTIDLYDIVLFKLL